MEAVQDLSQVEAPTEKRAGQADSSLGDSSPAIFEAQSMSDQESGIGRGSRRSVIAELPVEESGAVGAKSPHIPMSWICGPPCQSAACSVGKLS